MNQTLTLHLIDNQGLILVESDFPLDLFKAIKKHSDENDLPIDDVFYHIFHLFRKFHKLSKPEYFEHSNILEFPK